MSPRNFTSLLSGFPKKGSGKAGKESKPLHFVLLEPALPSPLKLCRSVLFVSVLLVPACLRAGPCKVAEVWAFSKHSFLKWIYCCESMLFQRGLSTSCSSETVCTGHRHCLVVYREPTSLPSRCVLILFIHSRLIIIHRWQHVAFWGSVEPRPSTQTPELSFSCSFWRHSFLRTDQEL